MVIENDKELEMSYQALRQLDNVDVVISASEDVMNGLGMGFVSLSEARTRIADRRLAYQHEIRDYLKERAGFTRIRVPCLYDTLEDCRQNREAPEPENVEVQSFLHTPLKVHTTQAVPADAWILSGLERDGFSILLHDYGPKKISVIKLMRRHFPGLGLREGKNFVESSDGSRPAVIVGLSEAKAFAIAKELVGFDAESTVIPPSMFDVDTESVMRFRADAAKGPRMNGSQFTKMNNLIDAIKIRLETAV